MKQYVTELLTQALKDVLGDQVGAVFPGLTIEITHPQEKFGDYSSNVALSAFKSLKEPFSGGPQGLASVLSVKAKELDHKDTFSKIEAVGGFINFTLSEKALAHIVFGFVEKIVPQQQGNGKKVLFEYSSPNTNKPLHIGHVRNDVYGKACIELLKATGYEVTSCEIINDRGIHIMKSVLMYLKHGQEKTPESEKLKPDHFVGKFYVMFTESASESETKEKELLEEAQGLLLKWEAGDGEVRKVWKQMNTWWQEGVKETYQKEGSTFDEVDFESEIFDKGRDLILDGVKTGVFTKEEDGSVSVDLTDQGLDKKYLLRKDGTTIYITQDLYLWHLRNEKHHPDLSLVTTAIEQSYHFSVLKRLFELMKFPWAGSFRHLPYEHVYLGKNKMSSRGGNTVSADELLEAVKEKVKSAMAGLEKIKATAENDELVEQVAFAAIKYGYLKYDTNTRIYFDIDETISLQGNTGPYLQYAHSRMRSILKKAGKFELQSPSDLAMPEALGLMRKLLHYNETIEIAAVEYKPSLLANYLYELASSFSTFYDAVPILSNEDANEKNQLLTLLTATGNVLKHGLNLLGIVAPEEM